MATLREIAQDPDFQSLPDSEKIKALTEIEPDLRGLSFNEQMKALSDLSGQKKRKIEGEGAFGLPRMEVPVIPGVPYGPRFDPLVSLSNVPSDIAQYGKGIAEAVSHPIQTAEAASKLLSPLGPALSLARGEIPAQVGLLKSLAKSYGTPERIGMSVEEHPIRTLADISSIVGGAGAGLGPKGIEVMKIAGRMDPLTAAIEGTTKAGRVASKYIKQAASGVLGGATGKGSASFMQAGKPEFFRSLWGKSTGDQLVYKAQSGLKNIIVEGKGEYRAGLEKLKGVKGQVDFTPITDNLQSALDSFEVNYKAEAFNRLISNAYKGKAAKSLRDADIDEVFRYSTVDKSAIPDILEATKTIKQWGENKDLLNIRQLDILKRKLGNMYSESNNGRAFINNVYAGTKEAIEIGYPGYRNMMKGYSDMIDMENQIASSLGIKDPNMRQVAVDTSLRKLLSAMREDNDFRRSLIERVSKKTTGDFEAELAGYNLRPMQPGGLFGKNLEAGFIFGSIFSRPSMISGILATSPRLAGTIAHSLSISAKKTGEIARMAEKLSRQSIPFRQPYFQAQEPGEQ